jgi:hypothetical protein
MSENKSTKVTPTIDPTKSTGYENYKFKPGQLVYYRQSDKKRTFGLGRIARPFTIGDGLAMGPIWIVKLQKGHTSHDGYEYDGILAKQMVPIEP